MGTHQGAVSEKHLQYYLDEYSFRFNRRLSKHRGKLFYRIIQLAVCQEAITMDEITGKKLNTIYSGYFTKADTQ